mgnify:CR=1 FL=1
MSIFDKNEEAIKEQEEKAEELLKEASAEKNLKQLAIDRLGFAPRWVHIHDKRFLDWSGSQGDLVFGDSYGNAETYSKDVVKTLLKKFPIYPLVRVKESSSFPYFCPESVKKEGCEITTIPSGVWYLADGLDSYSYCINWFTEIFPGEILKIKVWINYGSEIAHIRWENHHNPDYSISRRDQFSCSVSPKNWCGECPGRGTDKALYSYYIFSYSDLKPLEVQDGQE